MVEGRGTIIRIIVRNSTQGVIYVWYNGSWNDQPKATELDCILIQSTIVNNGDATDTIYGEFVSADVIPAERLRIEAKITVAERIYPSWSFTMPAKDVNIIINSGHVE